jgi:hypothetical protein
VTLRDAISHLPRLLAGAVGLALLYAGYREGISAYALHLAAKKSPGGLHAAAGLTPDNADIWRERARAAAGADPATAATLFEHTLLLNPADAGARIALGLLAESAGQLENAERHLRAASALSRRVKPQLALAYFYARHGPVEEFWSAANRAAAIEGADLQPLFAVAHAVVPDPAQVAASLQLSSQPAIAAYTKFLLGRPDAAPLAGVALRLDASPAHRDLLLAVTGRLLREGSADSAVRLWNRLYPGSLDPAAGRSIVNPDFAPGDGAGFDWRHTPAFGLTLRRAAGDLRVEFTGRQPESAVLIEQDIPVLPRRAYRLSWAGTQTGNPIRSGLVWTLGHSRRAPIPATPDAAGSTAFETARGETILRLALEYQRPPGTTRLEGVLNLQSIELTLR